ncbi:MAG: histidine phosphatase family protein [Fodinibius sp.]|nr:histidine phosphatase family protein [Fodinibius sp.]
MGVTNIYLARHGETEYNRCKQIQGRGIDASLNDTGRCQAQAIAHHLKDAELNRIFSSSLKRSLETAEIVGHANNLDVLPYENLDEMNFGMSSGGPISDIEDDLNSLHQQMERSGNVDHATEQGESPLAVLRRASAQMQLLIREHRDTNLLFVLHGRLLRILLSDWLQYGLANMHRVPHSNGALYHIRWDGVEYEPVYLNKTTHLDLSST